jgi:hypothetical protein
MGVVIHPLWRLAKSCKGSRTTYLNLFFSFNFKFFYGKSTLYPPNIVFTYWQSDAQYLIFGR